MTLSKLHPVKLLLLDVDGVLTGGQIIYSGGNVETKIFNVKDGLGIRMLQEAGIDVGIVSGRKSDALIQRCQDLHISIIYDGTKDKGAVMNQILLQQGLDAHEVAFMGDDLPDISLMKKVGVCIAVNDAHELVKKTADIITTRNGGEGAVREICEMILEAKNLLEKTIIHWI